MQFRGILHSWNLPLSMIQWSNVVDVKPTVYIHMYIYIYIHTVDEESILGEMIGKHSHIKLKSSHMWGYLPLLFVQRI